MKQLTLSQSIEECLLEKQAQQLSPHTVADYTNAFRKLQAYLGDPERSKAESKDVPFAGIAADQVIAQHACGPRCGVVWRGGSSPGSRRRGWHRGCLDLVGLADGTRCC